MGRRARRWLTAIAVLLALCMAGLWVLAWLVQPDRLARFMLDRVGAELGLALTATGPAHYRLRPAPVLDLAGIDARQPGATTPVFQADALRLALPWSSLRGTSTEVTRIELQAPRLDLDALDAWLATRPATTAPTPLPLLTSGLALRNGNVHASGWTLAVETLDVDRIDPTRPSHLRANGALDLGGGALPLHLDLRGQPSGQLSDLHIALAPTRLSLGLPDGPVQYTATLPSGRLRVAEAVELDSPALQLSGPSPLPPLEGELRLRLAGGQLDLDYRGNLPDWPSDWPPLPSPLHEAPAPWQWWARYAGPQDFSAPLALQASRTGLRFDGRARVIDVLDWIDTPGPSPLPPAEGVIEADVLVVEGVRLEGVRMTLQAPAPASTADGQDP